MVALCNWSVTLQYLQNFLWQSIVRICDHGVCWKALEALFMGAIPSFVSSLSSSCSFVCHTYDHRRDRSGIKIALDFLVSMVLLVHIWWRASHLPSAVDGFKYCKRFGGIALGRPVKSRHMFMAKLLMPSFAEWKCYLVGQDPMDVS